MESQEGYRMEMERQREVIGEIMQLLAEIIEKKDLPTDVIQQKRQQIKERLSSINIESLDDPKLRDMIVDFYVPDRNLTKPKNYPSAEDFSTRLEEVMGETIPEAEIVNVPSLIELRNFGRLNFDEIGARGRERLSDYLYDLGIVMSYKHAYEAAFGESDHISIRHDGRIENGRHRTATLKALSEDYITDSGLPEWVEIDLDER